LQWR